MAKRKIYYLGVEPVYVLHAPCAPGMVKVQYLSDVFNDTGTIVKYKGEKTVTAEDNLTSFPCP